MAEIVKPHSSFWYHGPVKDYELMLLDMCDLIDKNIDCFYKMKKQIDDIKKNLPEKTYEQRTLDFLNDRGPPIGS